ncbi:LysR family transcriptional regulator [Paracoccus siganidrum]|uniref:LysR family transcriptional regulator n=1 Tax=Paracoccus siganidrum TaxID=1276757 RepID=A0A418ZS34_9RHOB|nr:LysR family transcriptional regulator [Paracoccus siganidrum]RJK99937.1 LysR family transcriptional regulator [Paracoccus siganidrum]RMC24332.1 LysR family transcriptional regulator [Paracoccus siganidrum]
MDRIELYRIFTRVIETRSFTKAADTLQMPRSSVSTAIAELEARLGTRLLNRTTRMVAPTNEGEEFYDRCLGFLAESEEMEAMFRSASRRLEGRIRVDVPGRIGRLILAPALPGFLSLWPGIRVELGMTDRTVDLVGERVDLALRVGPLPNSGLRARKLGEIAQINVASPAYLAQYGTPLAPADLDRHWQVAYASPSTGRVADWEWRDRGRVQTRPVPWRISANSAEGYIACALAGMGLIQIPAYDVAHHLAAGELVEIMPDHRAEPMPMHLLFPGSSRPLRRLTAFADWMEGVLRRSLRQ